MLRFSLALLLLLMSFPASADPMQSEIRRQLISSCKFWDTCGQYFKPKYRSYRRYELHRRLPEVRVYGYRDERHDLQCREFVTAVGEERYGRDRAKEAAEASWMEAVRARYGTKLMDLRNSRGGTWECGRSSTGNRASEKAQDLVGKFLEQCELKARPCRAELERVEK